MNPYRSLNSPSSFLTDSRTPRYDELTDSVEDYVLDVLRDQLNRRQPMDNVSRNLLRLLTATCGYKEVRLMAVQRLEMWLQNPKARPGSRFRGSLRFRKDEDDVTLLIWCGFLVADKTSAGPPDVSVHELQDAWSRRHGRDLQPHQNPSQAESPPESLHAVCPVRRSEALASQAPLTPLISPNMWKCLGTCVLLCCDDCCDGLHCSELLNAHRDNLGTMIKLVIFNELSNARNPNNMQVLHTVLQHSPEQAPKVRGLFLSSLI